MGPFVNRILQWIIAFKSTTSFGFGANVVFERGDVSGEDHRLWKRLWKRTDRLMSITQAIETVAAK